jgi:8-oxo-dGDP phosphatase
MKQAWFPRAEFERMLRDGEIVDGSTMAAYTQLVLTGRTGSS